MMNKTFFVNIKLLFFSHGAIFRIVALMFLITLLTTLSAYGIYFWVAFAGISLLLIPLYRYIDTSAYYVFLFGILYGLFSFNLNIPYSGSLLISYFIVPLPLYCFGRWLINKLNNRDDQIVIFIFLSIVCLTFILLFRTIVDISQNNIISATRTFEIEGVENISATLYGLYIAVTIVGIPMFINLIHTNKLLSYFFLILSSLGILATIHLINRTGLIIAIVSILVGLIYRSRNNISKYLIISSLFILMAFVLIKSNIIPEEVIEAYKDRNENSEQLGMSLAGGRGHRWIDAIERVFKMPFGWYHESSNIGYKYVHNWWLDVARVVGLIPFLLLVLPTFVSIKNCIKLFVEKNKIINILLISLNIVLFLATFVEPVMEGCVMIAYFYFFVWGMTSQKVKLQKRCL